MSNLLGTSAFGLRLPIVKKGDDLVDLIMSSLKRAHESGEYTPKENDIIGITESVVGRAGGRYVSVNDIVESLKKIFPNSERVYVYNPIFSRNRFSIILRGISRYFSSVCIVSDEFDEVGNYYKHNITKVNYKDLYREIVENEGAEFGWIDDKNFEIKESNPTINCTLHPDLWRGKSGGVYLNEICNDVSTWGLLGSNKMGEELLKLYPDHKDKKLVDELQWKIEKEFGLYHVDVMIYGDGCFKDAQSGIWEFADPVVSPAYTDGLIGSPSELKLKYLADDEFENLTGDELTEAIKSRIKSKNVVQGNMETQGTTPRNYTDLLGSLMDLISGSGDKGTPVVIVQDYFKNYSND